MAEKLSEILKSSYKTEMYADSEMAKALEDRIDYLECLIGRLLMDAGDAYGNCILSAINELGDAGKSWKMNLSKEEIEMLKTLDPELEEYRGGE